jgi:hypothetical protein
VRSEPALAAEGEIVDLIEGTLHWNTQPDERGETEAVIERSVDL